MNISKQASKYRDLILRYYRKYPHLSMTKLAVIITSENDVPIQAEGFRKIVSYVVRQEVSKQAKEFDFDFEEKEFEFEDIPSSAIKPSFYDLPNQYQRILIISDIHIKYHDNDALRIALKYGYDNKCDTIILNGDIIDFAGISRFEKSLLDRNIAYERNLVIMFLTKLREKFPKQKIIFKAGNHELRLKKFIENNAEQLEGIQELEIENFLKLYQFNVDYVDPYSIIKVGSLNIIHGHEILGSGINVARMHLLKAFDNVLFGHFHRTQDYIQRNIKDKTFGGWSIGCLCGLYPTFFPVNNWNHGFAFVIREGDFFKVENKKIINSQVL